MSKKVLVTGANGYIGRHVVKQLLDSGCDVVVSDVRFDGIDSRAKLNKTPLFEKNEHIYTDFGEPDVCIHMAWRNGFQHNNISHIEELSKHYEFIQSMLQQGLKQLVVMGTMHEIGYWEGAITEDTPANPTSLYGIAKNALRQLAILEAKNNNAILQWVRAYYIIGDDEKNNSIFTKIVQAEKEGKTTFPFTTGKNKYDFIDVDKLAEQISAVATQTKVHGIINCCTGQPMSLAERVEKFIKDKGYKIKLEYGAYPDRPYDSPGVWGDTTKINAILEER